MKLLIKKNKVSDFCIYRNNEVTVVDGVLTIGEKSYSHNENECVFSKAVCFPSLCSTGTRL